MKAHTRSRALRIIGSALLGSPLSDSEISQVAEALTRDRDFAEDIARLLKGALSSATPSIKTPPSSQTNPPRTSYPPTPTVGDYIELALQLIKARRISKSELSELLGVLSPKHRDFINTAPSIRDMVTLFISISTETEARNFIHMLEAQELPKPDDYLRGILRRP